MTFSATETNLKAIIKKLSIAGLTTVLAVCIFFPTSSQGHDHSVETLVSPDSAVGKKALGLTPPNLNEIVSSVAAPIRVLRFDQLLNVSIDSMMLSRGHVFHSTDIEMIGRAATRPAHSKDRFRLDFHERQKEDYQSGVMLHEMCDALKHVVFGVVQSDKYPHFSVGPKFVSAETPCPVNDMTVSEFTEHANKLFAEKSLYRWDAGLDGYVLFSNALFPNRNGEHGAEIPSDRLRNIIGFALTADPGVHNYYSIETFVATPGHRDCRCKSDISQSEIVKLSKSDDFCAEIDKQGNICAGNWVEYEEVVEKRRVFAPENLRRNPIQFNSFGSSDLGLIRSDVDYEKGIYVTNWCQIDPYFPCSEINISVLGETDSNSFAIELINRLCDGGCGASIARDHFVKVLSIAGGDLSEDTPGVDSWNEHIVSVNKTLKSISDGNFRLVAVPLGVALDRNTDLSGWLPVSIHNDNRDALGDIKSTEYFFVDELEIVVSNFVLKDRNLRDFLRFIYAEDTGGESACDYTNIECRANMRLRTYPTRTVWRRALSEPLRQAPD